MYPPLFIVLIASVTSILGNISRTSKCSETICPAVEATICVKVKPKHDNQSHRRYVMMSKCELKQIKCFNVRKGLLDDNIGPVNSDLTYEAGGSDFEPPEYDVKTTVVPVNLCNATSLRDGAESDEESDLSEIQNKISEVKNQPSFGPITGDHLEGNDQAALPEGEDQEDGAQTELVTEETQTTYNPQSKEGEPTGADATTNDPQPEEEEATGAGDTTNEPQSKEEVPTEADATNNDQEPKEEEHTELDTTTNDNQSKEESVTEASEQPETSRVADLSVSPTTEENPPGKNNNTESQADYRNENEKQKLENADHADDGRECPKKCPTGDVMVCARCSHHIYRTFMSACYMRMYQCRNPTEKLELVSRHACQGSAPYLGEMARPRHNLVEPQDDDPVLNYIFAAQDSGHPK